MKTFRLLILVMIVFVGCYKWDEIGITENPTDINQLQISSNFEWRTAIDIAFFIKNIQTDIIQISSLDGKSIFHKGVYDGESEVYHINTHIPIFLPSILINGDTVALSSNIIEYTLKGTQSFKELKAGTYLLFDGIDDYVRIPNYPNGKIIDDYPYTFSAWIKTPGFNSSDEDMVIISMADSVKNELYSGLYVGEDENGVAILNARKDDDNHNLISNYLVTDNEWHQVVGVYVHNERRYLYVDGVLMGSDTRKADFSTQLIFNIGRLATENPEAYFNGLIDEVQIWDKALSSSEVSDYYNNSPLGTESNLKAYWKINEATGGTISDQSGNNNTGYIVGATWSIEGSVDNDNDGVLNVDDDYPNDADRSLNNYFPASSFGTLAFEDLWPAKGDYDFNDLVVDYQFKTVTNSDDYITEIYGYFVVKAIGASYKNGFGFQFPNLNVDATDITVSGYNILASYITLAINGLESGQIYPTIIVFDNAFDLLPHPGGGFHVNTHPSSAHVIPDTVNIVMTLAPNEYTINDLDIANFNPFIIVNQERGKEVHLPDHRPTSLVDITYFRTLYDDSDAFSDRYYKTENNLPWAINVYETFVYPTEKTSIIDAHIKFSPWAQSSGDLFPDWYQDQPDYRNTDNIYVINN